MKSLKEKIEAREHGLLLYSFTPPKITTEKEKLQTIAEKQINRINNLAIDGLILYDIQDESHRTNEQRTFPFIQTVPPEEYFRHYLNSIKAPSIIYKSIANQTKESFNEWLCNNKDLENFVFVGASSSAQVAETNFALTDAYDLRKELHQHLMLGGITIPERHSKKGDEHKRIFSKTEKGCSFFVSQCVYNVYESKNLLSDYHYDSIDNNYELKPIFFTLSPCGSIKTLEFMKWLGIEVPKWLYNDLKHAKDILETSVRTSILIADEILEFAAQKQIPVGFNIESISNKKDEIDAATEILTVVAGRLKQARKKTTVETVAEASPL
ncbi:5,10-methylenetetrahydrofolate reductase [Lacibacter luteus]|uniref:5,10-methylenetetrahydrofolate reductase n=1 Tax=Lacibacter luteus TaxID=2508719 RepID=A0A4Q1CGK4_9BACT|nr:methylenetetrahydrofolate reductase [Lacibacter luteus]RXK58961.1 5,10-methylenetetrahydrofolate reductase [Lacibacter luteus]